MKTLSTTCLTLCIFMFCASAFAQKAQLKKAEKAYEQFSYIDAQEIYLKVVEDGYRSAQILKRLGNTYYFNSQYSDAAKWYTDLIAEFPEETEPEYYFRAAQSLKSTSNYERADELMEKFSQMRGSSLIVQNYQNNKEYLSKLAKRSDRYLADQVAINTENSDFGGAYYQGKFVFSSAIDTVVNGKPRLYEWNKQPYLNLYMADMDEKGNLSGMEKLKGDINTKFHESSAAFTEDGLTVYFTRNNYLDGKKGRDKERHIRLKIYKATRTADNMWTNVVELPFNSEGYSVAHPALSADEKRIYFSSDMPGTYGESDLWYVDILGENSYGNPVNLGPGINTEAKENFPFISDKNHLYFSTNGRAGLGGLDIFRTALDEKGLPTEIVALGEPVNSNKDDFAFLMDEEKNIGFLSSNRMGSEGSASDDIYRITRICEIAVSGKITEVNTDKLLPGATVILLDDNNNELKRTTADSEAAYSFILDCDKVYTIRATKEEYKPSEKILTTPEESSALTVSLELEPLDPCPPSDLGCRLDLQPIYFDFDRYNIRRDAEIELAKILAAMREYPELKIHIESHTDSRGSVEYNELLSERRAQSTLEWLISKGVNRDRLSAKGYGESRLINECKDGVPCTEEQHQLNRRSMFIIQN